MNVSRTIRIQLVIFAVVTAIAMAAVGLAYIQLPSLFGIGRYTVTLELAEAGNLYPNANVTYRGTEVGQVTAVRLTDRGVEAEMSLRSNIPIPSDLDAQVHSQTAVGEQYVALLPRSDSPPLRNGDVIPVDRTSVPPEIGRLLDAANRGVAAIPNENVKTVIDESYTALGGLGPEFARLVRASTDLAIGADHDLDALIALIDDSPPLLDSQTDSADAIHAWAAHLATVTDQLHTSDNAVAGILDRGPAVTDEVRQLFDRIQPTLPIVLANLVSIGQVALVYQPSIEQLLVLLPQGTAALAATMVPNLRTKGFFGFYLDFNLNLNFPHPCTTGFLPAQQRRPPTFEDYPDRPAGDVYCRIPQDAEWSSVRGARNYPCITRPGKRAPTVAMCESDEQYVPLNEDQNWKGDPNATTTGQDIPQLPAVAATEYDPSTGTYVAPDGRQYTQSNLSANTPKEKTWQSMLIPPTAN